MLHIMKNISEKLDTVVSFRNRCARIAIPSSIIGIIIGELSSSFDSKILDYIAWIPISIGLLSLLRIFNF